MGEVGIDEVGELIASGYMSHALVIVGFWRFDRWRGEHEEVPQKYLD